MTRPLALTAAFAAGIAVGALGTAMGVIANPDRRPEIDRVIRDARTRVDLNRLGGRP